MEAEHALPLQWGVLAAEGVGKRLGGRWLFRGVSFSLPPGDALVVTGANGSGKSTLLRTLAGLVHPTEGRVRLPEGDPRRTLGMAAVEAGLYPTLTPAEHLQFTAQARGCEPRVDEMLAQVGLASAAGVLAAKLSTGMRARLRLAIALQARPAVLLLDEPGAGLDEQGRELVEEIVREQRGRGALVLATNDPAERRLATHELRLGE